MFPRSLQVKGNFNEGGCFDFYLDFYLTKKVYTFYQIIFVLQCTQK